MIRVTTTVTGVEALASRLRAAGVRVEAALQAGLLEAGAAVQGEAQRLVADPPKTGAIYQRYNPRRVHQASAPGQAPATDLGNLIAGIVLDETDLATGSIVVASTAPYSRMLEFGTSKMAPRPFLRRAAEQMRPRVVAILTAAINRGAR